VRKSDIDALTNGNGFLKRIKRRDEAELKRSCGSCEAGLDNFRLFQIFWSTLARRDVAQEVDIRELRPGVFYDASVLVI